MVKIRHQAYKLRPDVATFTPLFCAIKFAPDVYKKIVAFCVKFVYNIVAEVE